ncbi:KGG domain-containing protein [Nitrosomonas ureae]|uniref:Stress-induced acidophilic repeat protein n=1 Tax=Nitrosomonas ureae TaxID=44577 RepID=A0A2T5ISW1_9PROT|nr:KGG domain-containing protein [Nitrosomonas ureae]PTQ86908.1 stress-induced acidophilic repeat protein [Nitrosomonas ureae]
MNTKTSRNKDNDQSDNTSNRGFASMDPKKQRDIASEGGRAAHQKGTAHEFDSDEAAEAGRKGGQAQGKNQSSSTLHRGQSNRNNENDEDSGNASSARGGSSQQHAEAGRQSHKNK